MPHFTPLSYFQVMTAAAAACRRAVLEADPRLAEAMYLAQVRGRRLCLNEGIVIGPMARGMGFRH